ncbi:MAG: SMP-30/gluconolactonase/LRE family protein [Saprospiraceae bacterium]|nr:SMP-30/gluconolactonase/LRE family protein [Saprospiraceae bacterium]
MKLFNGFLASVFVLLTFSMCKQKTAEVGKSVGHIEIKDPEMLTLIDSNAIIEILADGFTWSEGPLWLAKENKVIFTDVPENTIYAWDPQNGKQIYLKPSGYTIINDKGGTEGANGLMLDGDGNLILCQHGNRSIAKMLTPLATPKDSFLFLANMFNGKKFNSPNDLHITKDGDIFFTDPPYGLPKQDDDAIKELTYNGVYRLQKDGKIILFDSTLTRPNGITFSADEKYMYVANSDENKAIWMKYELDENKNIIDRKLFADVTHLIPTSKGLPDGMKIGKKGLIFATGPGGVLVFNQDSRHIGTINTGQATANCALDADEKYLYMTAHSYLMRVALKP